MVALIMTIWNTGKERNKMYRILFTLRDITTGEVLSQGVSAQSYVRKGNAVRYAKENFSHTTGNIAFEWEIREEKVCRT